MKMDLSKIEYEVSDMNQEEIQKKHGDMFAEGWNPWFDVADGWLPIIDSAFDLIKWDIEHNGMPKVEIHQIKEKFGALEIYYQGGDEKTHGIIAMARNISLHTCERCGANQEVGKTTGWIKILCKTCAEETDKIHMWELK